MVNLPYILECPDCHGTDFRRDDGDNFICNDCDCVIEQADAGDYLTED